MREILTILAAAVLAVLAAALAVPPFVDWSAWGDTLGRRLGTALDGQATIGGPVSVRLLPSPRFEAGHFSIAGRGYTIEADRTSFELGLAPLLRGVLTVTSAQLDRARLAIDVDALRSRGGDTPAAFGIERLVLRDATLSATSGASVRSLEHIDLTASAESAAGPFKADGYLRADTRVLPFHLATGAIAIDRMPLKLVVDPLAGWPRIEAAGTLLWDAPGPRVQGSMTLAGDVPGVARNSTAPPMPWRAKLEGLASATQGRADTLELRLGDDSARLVASGAGELGPDGALTASLGSERPDFDRFRETYDVARLLHAFDTGGSGRTMSLDWRTDAALLGGDVLADLRLSLRSPKDGPAGAAAASFAASLPHGGAVSVRGTIDRARTGVGDFAIRSGDASAFLRWAGGLLPDGHAPPSMPFARMDLAGHVVASADALELTNLRATLDRSDLRGRLTATPARAGTPAKVTAVLTSPALDLDALPDLGTAAGAAGALDFAVSLDAKAVRVARVGRGAVDAGHIVVSVNRAGDSLLLDRLDLEDVGGATVRLHGQLTPGRARLAGVLEAQQLATVAALARRVAPSVTVEALAARATVLAPARLDLELDATSREGLWRPTWVSLSGTAGGTQLSAIISPAREGRDGVAGTLTLNAPDAALLLRQAGLPVLPLRGIGGGQVEARLSGKPGAPLTIAATARLAGATFGFEGASSIDPDAPSADGTVRISAADLAPLLRIFGIPADLLVRQPIDASARFEGTGDRVALTNIVGLIGPSQVTGDLRREGAGPIAGALRVDRLDIASLTGLLLGPLPPTTGERLWSPLSWAPQPIDPPGVAVDLTAGRLALGLFGSATNVRGHLAIEPRAITARDVQADWAGGTLAGAWSLRRQGETASLTADVSVTDAAVALPWATARASGTIAVAGAGPTPAGLIGSLAGQGALRVTDLHLAGADPLAPGRVAAAVDAERIALEPRTIETALAQELGGAPHLVATLAQSLTIAAGKAEVAPLAATGDWGEATLSARFDLATGRIDLRDMLRTTPPTDWTGPPPVVSLAWTGPVGTPARQTDASGLIETLAAHGLAREEARVAAIEADRRERSFFNRRLKSERSGEAERRAEDMRQEALREAARQEVLRQEALRRERERRPVDPPPVAAPLDLRPPGIAVPAISTPVPILPDPSSAGRY